MVVGGLAHFVGYSVDLPALPVQINLGMNCFLAVEYIILVSLLYTVTS